MKVRFLVDVDGVLIKSTVGIPGAGEAVRNLRDCGDVSFVTNISTVSPQMLSEKLNGFDIDSDPSEFSTAGSVAIDHLLRNYDGAKILVDGTKEFKRQAQEAGVQVVKQNPDIVLMAFNRDGNNLVLGGNTYDAIKKHTPFFATHDNIDCPTRNGFMGDTGLFLKGLKHGHNLTPELIFGKPEQPMYDYIARKYGLTGAETIVMIGDGTSDMKFAKGPIAEKHPSSFGAFVKTGGVTHERMIREGCAPDFVNDSIGDFAKLVKSLQDTDPAALSNLSSSLERQ
ncbi:MAG: HAD hydrolase-like protein [Firmicutes bacterium]|nr:HAD hydrolase-like protein [Bacillota bacterium]